MPPRSTTRRLGRIRRRTFSATLLGLSADRSIGPLKEYLHAAGLTASPAEKLDLVMLEDFNHYAELLAAEGIPLARDDREEDMPPTPRLITFQLHVRGVVALSALAAFFLGLLADNLYLAATTGLDLLP